MKDQKKYRVLTTYRLIGRDELAAELGVSPHHLTCVFQGIRRSKRIEDALAAYGIQCHRYRKAK